MLALGKFELLLDLGKSPAHFFDFYRLSLKLLVLRFLNRNLVLGIFQLGIEEFLLVLQHGNGLTVDRTLIRRDLHALPSRFFELRGLGKLHGHLIELGLHLRLQRPHRRLRNVLATVVRILLR